MGQSFLTHDEKSSGSPSPDLLQFNGGSTNPKFFGSLSSVKESSSSSRSPLLESVDSEERNGGASSSSASSTSARSPLSSPSGTTAAFSDVYSSLVPTPILPGNVSRLREKFMDEERYKRSREFTIHVDQHTICRNEDAFGKEAMSDPDCRYITRPATTSPFHYNRRSRGGTMPTTTRSRSSLHALSPMSYGTNSSNNIKSRIRTLPPPSSSATTTYDDDKLDNSIRADNDLSDCLEKLALGGSCTNTNNNHMGSFTNETPLVRHRPRTRPYVPPPRSVIIRAGYLPVVQTADVIPPRSGRPSASASQVGSPRRRVEHEQDLVNKCNSEFVSAGPRTSTTIPQVHRKEELHLVSSPRPSTSKSLLEAEQRRAFVVTKHEVHREKKVLRKEAGVNTSAEVLVLPKGTKTSVLLKSGILDEVDGVKGLNKKRKNRSKKKKKGGIRRITRVFGRIMIRLVELF